MQYKKTLKWIYSLCIASFVILWIVCFFPSKNGYIHVNSLENNLGSLTKDMTISQTFVAHENNLSSIGVIIGKYMKSGVGNIIFTLTEGENLVYKSEVDLRKVKESKFFYVEFDPITNSQNKEFKININVDSDLKENVTIYNSHDNQYDYGSAYINDLKQDFDISFFSGYSMSKVEAIKKVVDNINLSSMCLIILLLLFIISLITVLNFI